MTDTHDDDQEALYRAMCFVIRDASGMTWEEAAPKLKSSGVKFSMVFKIAELSSSPDEFWEAIDVESERLLSDRLRRILHDCGPKTLADISRGRLHGLAKHGALLRLVYAGDDEDCSLLILGPTGCGKTATAAALVRRSKASTVWFSGSELLLSVRRHPLGQGDPPELQRAIDAELLVVDDPDWIRSSGADELFAIICAERERRAAPTIVTSGATREQFLARYGGAVLRRIVESSRDANGAPTGRVVDCHGATNA